jgi:hypothetical protein
MSVPKVPFKSAAQIKRELEMAAGAKRVAHHSGGRAPVTPAGKAKAKGEVKPRVAEDDPL